GLQGDGIELGSGAKRKRVQVTRQSESLAGSGKIRQAQQRLREAKVQVGESGIDGCCQLEVGGGVEHFALPLFLRALKQQRRQSPALLGGEVGGDGRRKGSAVFEIDG